MILILTNGADATADFFETKLREHGAAYTRLNTETLQDCGLRFCIPAIDATALLIRGISIELQSVDAVYYRRPHPPNISGVTDPAIAAWIASELRQAWGGVLASASEITWVNHPFAIASASYKPEQLARASRIGLPVPDSLITTDPADARAFCEQHRWRVVTKPIGHGEIRTSCPGEDRIVYTNALDPSHANLLSRVSDCPTLLQARITKALDVRVTIAGSECLAVALHSQEQPISSVDCRRDNMEGMRYSSHALPRSLEDALLGMVWSYGLRYAAIDLALDREGRYWFLELNPAGQWAWLEERTGVPIAEAILRTLRSGATNSHS